MLVKLLKYIEVLNQSMDPQKSLTVSKKENLPAIIRMKINK